MFKTEKDLREQIRKDYEATGPEGKRSFRRAVQHPHYYAKSLGESLPPGTAATIYNKGQCDGIIPTKWLTAYDIQRFGTAPLCPICHQVHTRRTCPNKEKGKPRPRRNINLTDARSTFETITNSQFTTPDYLVELTDLLASHLIMKEQRV